MKLRILGRSKANTCDALWPHLSAYADGEASDSESARVQAHIAACDQCECALSLIQGTSVSLASTHEVDPPAYLRGAILAATTTLDASPARAKLARRPMRLQWGFGAAALAGVLAALVFHSNQPSVDMPVMDPTPPRATARNQPAAPQIQAENPAIQPDPSIPNDTSVPSSIETAGTGATQENIQRDLRTAELRQPSQSAPGGLVVIEIPRTAGKAAVKVASTGPKPSAKAKPDAPMSVAENAPMPPMDMMPEASAPKIDMAVMSTPMPMDLPMNIAENVPAAPAEPIARKIVMTAEPKALPLGQVSSLADLKKSLRQQSIQWNRPDAMRGLTSKQISVEIVKRSF